MELLQKKDSNILNLKNKATAQKSMAKQAATNASNDLRELKQSQLAKEACFKSNQRMMKRTHSVVVLEQNKCISELQRDHKDTIDVLVNEVQETRKVARVANRKFSSVKVLADKRQSTINHSKEKVNELRDSIADGCDVRNELENTIVVMKENHKKIIGEKEKTIRGQLTKISELEYKCSHGIEEIQVRKTFLTCLHL